MPVLKVNDSLRYALTGIRIPVISEPIDNCPQCGVSGYRDGICQNRTTCGYMDPKLIAALQAWQQATMTQQAIREQQSESMGKPPKKAASKIALQQSPKVVVDKFSESTEKVAPQRCKLCGEKSVVDGECTTWTSDGGKCGGSLPPKGLQTPHTEFTGIDEDAIPNKGPTIRPTYSIWKSRARKKIDKSKKDLNEKNARAIDPRTVDPGAMLDSSIAIATEPVVRAREMLDVDAKMQNKQKMDAAMGDTNDKTDNNSEELQ
jgi:hypothetical protein